MMEETSPSPSSPFSRVALPVLLRCISNVTYLFLQVSPLRDVSLGTWKPPFWNAYIQGDKASVSSSLGRVGAWPHGYLASICKTTSCSKHVSVFLYPWEYSPCRWPPTTMGRLGMVKDAVKFPHVRTNDCSSWEKVYNGVCLLGCLRGGEPFLSLQPSHGLPVIPITVWFNAHPVIKQFSFPLGFFNYISPTPASPLNLNRKKALGKI